MAEVGDRIRMHSRDGVRPDFWGKEAVVVGSRAGLMLLDFDDMKKSDGQPYRVSSKNFDVIESGPSEAEIRALFNITCCPTCKRPFEEEN